MALAASVGTETDPAACGGPFLSDPRDTAFSLDIPKYRYDNLMSENFQRMTASDDS